MSTPTFDNLFVCANVGALFLDHAWVSTRTTRMVALAVGGGVGGRVDTSSSSSSATSSVGLLMYTSGSSSSTLTAASTSVGLSRRPSTVVLLLAIVVCFATGMSNSRTRIVTSSSLARWTDALKRPTHGSILPLALANVVYLSSKSVEGRRVVSVHVPSLSPATRIVSSAAARTSQRGNSTNEVAEIDNRPPRLSSKISSDCAVPMSCSNTSNEITP